MPAESAAQVGGAGPKDRYERELVLARSSVRCQAKTADLLPPRTRMTGGSAGARFVLWSAAISHCALSSWPGAACLPAGPGSAGRQGRAPAPLRRAPLPGQRSGLLGDLCSPAVSRSGPRSPLFNVWAVRLVSLSGVTPRVSARQCVRSGFLFRLADIFMYARRPGRCPGPEVPGARAEGRLSPTAVCHICTPRPRRAVLPRPSRGGHGGGCKAGPEPLCMNAPGRRAIGCVAFQPAGTIRSVASCPRGGDVSPDERPGQMEPRR